MKHSHLIFALLMAAALTACEDPSNVGIGLIGEEGGDPGFIVVDATEADTIATVDVTGSALSILSGHVEDPLFGTVDATGLLDVTPGEGVDNTFQSNPMASARLILFPTYLYGDSLSQVTLRVRDMADEWEPDGVTADTTFAGGALVTEVTFTASDSLFVIPLPDDWLSANESTLRSNNFNEEFHGFMIEPVSGDAVLGFGQGASRLEAVTVLADTARFDVSKTATTVRRATPMAVDADHVPMQDGAGPNVSLRFDLSDEALNRVALNRAAIAVPIDTLALRQTPAPSFVRPMIPTVNLIGVSEDDVVFLIETLVLNDDDELVPETSSGNLREFLHDVIHGDVTLDHFELRAPSDINTVSVLLFYGVGVADKAPKTVLTVTPVDR